MWGADVTPPRPPALTPAPLSQHRDWVTPSHLQSGAWHSCTPKLSTAPQLAREWRLGWRLPPALSGPQPPLLPVNCWCPACCHHETLTSLPLPECSSHCYPIPCWSLSQLGPNITSWNLTLITFNYNLPPPQRWPSQPHCWLYICHTYHFLKYYKNPVTFLAFMWLLLATWWQEAIH